MVGKIPFTWRDDTKVLSKEALWNFLTERLSVWTDCNSTRLTCLKDCSDLDFFKWFHFFGAWSFGCHLSKLQETVILRRSLNVSEFLAVANKHGVSWNLEELTELTTQNSGIRVDYVYSDLSFEDCLPDALPDCLDLLGKDFQRVNVCPANHV